MINFKTTNSSVQGWGETKKIKGQKIKPKLEAILKNRFFGRNKKMSAEYNQEPETAAYLGLQHQYS